MHMCASLPPLSSHSCRYSVIPPPFLNTFTLTQVTQHFAALCTTHISLHHFYYTAGVGYRVNYSIPTCTYLIAAIPHYPLHLYFSLSLVLKSDRNAE